jgi:hypothetical protein
MPVDRQAPLTFLETAFEAADSVGVFLKSYSSGRVAQRVRSVEDVKAPRFQAWLRAENAAGANVYVSVNSVECGQRSRRREAVAAIRHVFLDADDRADDVLRAIAEDRTLPAPSYVMRSSPGRAHMFWRADGFTKESVEALEKHLAAKLGTDPAATACTQVTRLPGFMNHKRACPFLVSVNYANTHRVFGPADFPLPPMSEALGHAHVSVATTGDAVDRARHYTAAIPPAIAGQHGDVHTFRVCCRLVRGFALTDDDALSVLREWNSRCLPPWSERELLDKVSRARRYGREPIGGLLEEHP